MKRGDRTMTDETMKAIYNEHAYTKDNYIVGYYKNGLVYASVIKYHFINLATFDTSSKKSGQCTACLRYRQNSKTVKTIEDNAIDTFVLCTLEQLEQTAKAYSKRANRGKAFERLVTEHYGQTWTDDNVEWWTGADIVVNGTGYQIKYDRCNFCNERQIEEQGWA
jgi:hypothetical protein